MASHSGLVIDPIADRHCAPPAAGNRAAIQDFHTGSSRAATAANTAAATTFLGQQANTYTGAGNLVALAASEIGTVGGSQAHLNMQPFLTLSFCVALQGIFPSQT